MRLNNIQLYEALTNKRIHNLYHANTLITSLSFIHVGGITSRGNIERLGLKQTTQSSDQIDKEYNVWNDIFLDTVDLHNYTYSHWNRENRYGPILFELKTELLLDEFLDNIWITTNNPTNWNNYDDHYFKNVSDYIDNLNENRQQKMITIRGIDKIISFKKYLSCVYIDNPHLRYDHINLFNFCCDMLSTELNKRGLSIPIQEHNCNNGCYCQYNYRDMHPYLLQKLFLD